MNKHLEELLKKYDIILIGAGAGLSEAAGFEYGGKAFSDNFGYMKEKYGVNDMYSAGFSHFDDYEEFWGYWAKMIYLMRYLEAAKPLYRRLHDLIKNKDYFILTTNVDHQFQKSGFDKKRLFYTQGDYGLFQCRKPCCQKTYDNEKAVKEMLDRTREHRIPSSLIPRCPVCGEPMTTNLRVDSRFVMDEGWRDAANRYRRFIERNAGKPILFLELGVGYNTPGIIKYPFWEMTCQNKNAHYCAIGLETPYIPREIQDRATAISGGIQVALG